MSIFRSKAMLSKLRFLFRRRFIARIIKDDGYNIMSIICDDSCQCRYFAPIDSLRFRTRYDLNSMRNITLKYLNNIYSSPRVILDVDASIQVEGKEIDIIDLQMGNLSGNNRFLPISLEYIHNNRISLI